METKSLFHILLAALLSGAPSADEADTPPCFDPAVVARVRRITIPPAPDVAPREILLSWPWRLNLDIDQRVAGPISGSQVEVMMRLHTGLTHKDADRLFFLRRRSDSWQVVGLEYRIADDVAQGFVRPVVDPVDDRELSPDGWVPPDYQRRLRPIEFDPASAWWLRLTNEGRPNRVSFGLPVNAWVARLADRRCPSTPPNALKRGGR